MTPPEAFRIVKVEPGSQVPLMVGVLSVVIYGDNVSPPALMIVGVTGTSESMINIVVIGRLVFPTKSIRVTLYVFDHCGIGLVGVKL
jgi:hypothetical protein